jgi:hypothetical protein
MKAHRISTFLAATIALYSPVFAQCDVIKLKVEKSIPPHSELRQSENAQIARDVRTLREAAVILDAKKHTAECRRLVAVVRGLVANPDRAVETSGDTDEDKAEILYDTRRRKTAANSAH